MPSRCSEWLDTRAGVPHHAHARKLGIAPWQALKDQLSPQQEEAFGSTSICDRCCQCCSLLGNSVILTRGLTASATPEQSGL